MIYRQRAKNHLLISSFTLIITAIFIGIWWYLNYDIDFLLTAGLFYFVFTLPAVLLHLQYTVCNVGEVIEITPRELKIRKNGREEIFIKSDLAKIIVYKPASLDKGGIPFSAMEYYRYARIVTKGGEEIIITCLMVTDVEKAVRQLNGVPLVRKKRIAFLCWK